MPHYPRRRYIYFPRTVVVKYILCNFKRFFSNNLMVEFEFFFFYNIDVSPISSGNQQLDHLIGGGLKEQASTILVGQPGSGKTCLALQFLTHDISPNTPSAYISLDKAPEKILERAITLRPSIQQNIENNELKFVEISTQDWTPNDPINELLLNIQLQCDALFNQFGAKNIVVDSLLPQGLHEFSAKQKQYFIHEFLGIIHTFKTTSLCILYEPTIHHSLWLNTDIVNDQILFHRDSKLDYTTYWLDISKNCDTNISGSYRFTFNNKQGLSLKHRQC
jgi:KaiC/GvpD/RAD55 family RecA-like ATPase